MDDASKRVLFDYLDSHQEEIISDLQSLIRHVSHSYDEAKAVSFLADKMRAFGYDEVRIDPVGNLLGRVGDGRTVLFCDAHIDTVTASGDEGWEYPPYEAVLSDGVIHGRGAADDKGPLLALVWAGRAIVDLDLKGDFTLWISGSVAEEDVTAAAVRALLKESPDISPDFVLIGEPSALAIMRGHKGRALLTFDVPGKAAHASAASRGENALIKALPLIEAVDQLDDFTVDPDLGPGTVEVTALKTVSPSLNTIPGQAVVIADRRLSCGETYDDVLFEAARMAAVVPDAVAKIASREVKSYTGYTIESKDYLASWVEKEDHPFVAAAKKAFADLFDKEATVSTWDFCTNASSICAEFGYPGIGFGPGDPLACHTNRDCVAVKDLLQAIAFYAVLPGYLPKP